MSSILQIEKAIIDRLKSKLDGYTSTTNASLPPEQAISAHVSELPLDPSEIGVPVTGTQVWVAFREQSFDPPPIGGVTNPVRPPSQSSRIVYELIIRSQDLRVKGHQRVYPILDVILDALTGWMPDEIEREGNLTKPLYPTKRGFTNMGAGIWVYSMTFVSTAIYTAPNKEI
ncbi:MAG: hypothetical protein ACRCZS_02275 [Chroococcidiopsis sp.]